MTGLRSEKEAGNLLSTYLLQGWVKEKYDSTFFINQS